MSGKGPSPALVLSLVARLPDESLTTALRHGGVEHFGWGMNRHLLAGIFDSVQQNTVATGQWKKGKTPKPATWPRPQSKPKKPKKKRTVRELYAAIKGQSER